MKLLLFITSLIALGAYVLTNVLQVVDAASCGAIEQALRMAGC